MAATSAEGSAMKVSISIGVTDDTATRFRRIAQETGEPLSAVFERFALAGERREAELAALKAEIVDVLDRHFR